MGLFQQHQVSCQPICLGVRRQVYDGLNDCSCLVCLSYTERIAGFLLKLCCFYVELVIKKISRIQCRVIRVAIN